jgi:hypothetical protein
MSFFRQSGVGSPMEYARRHGCGHAIPYDDAPGAVADMRERELDDEYVRTQLRRLQAEMAHEIERHVQQRNPAQGD